MKASRSYTSVAVGGLLESFLDYPEAHGLNPPLIRFKEENEIV